jgi:hypothetical protein
VLFVGKNNNFDPVRIKTTNNTFTILFFMQSVSYTQGATDIAVKWALYAPGHITSPH